MNGLMGALAGFMKGKGDQGAFEREQAIKNPEMKLKQALVKLQMESEKVRLEETKMKQALMNTFLQQYGQGAQGQPTSTPEGGEFNQAVESADKPGLTDQMASMDPMMMAVMKMVTGLDTLGAGRLSEQQSHNDVIEGQYIAEEVTNADGSKSRQYRPKYGKPPSLVTPPADGQTGPIGDSFQSQKLPTMKNQTAPPPVESFTWDEGGKKYEAIRNKQTGALVTEPKVIQQIKGETSETASKVALAKNALKYTKKLRDAFINKDGSINKALILKANAPMGGVGEGRKYKAMFEDALDARARAATGAAMPDTEVKNYTRMYFPSPLDGPETVIDKVTRLDSFMTDYLNMMDPTGRLRNQVMGAPQEAIDYLKANPRLKNAFKIKYGYIPEGID